MPRPRFPVWLDFLGRDRANDSFMNSQGDAVDTLESKEKELLSRLYRKGLERHDVNDDGEVITLTFDTDAEITDELFEQMSRLQSLTWLGLYGTRIHEPGLSHLARLTGLKRLNLARTNLTDDGLKQLAELKSLEALWIRDIQASDEAIYQLQLALPYCKFDWSW